MRSKCSSAASECMYVRDPTNADVRSDRGYLRPLWRTMSCFGYVWSVVFGGTISVNEETYRIVKRIGEGGEGGRGR